MTCDALDSQSPKMSATVLGKLAALRTELVDLAYELDRCGRVDAADVAMTTSARVAELCDELLPIEPCTPTTRPAV
jgi:hypothetical protein